MDDQSGSATTTVLQVLCLISNTAGTSEPIRPGGGSAPKLTKDVQSILTTFSRETTERALKTSAIKSTEEIRKVVEAEYEKLYPGRAKYLELRLKKLTEENESTERAFWLYFHGFLESAKETDSKDSNQYDIHFFYNVWSRWSALSTRAKAEYKRKATQNVNAYPAPKITDSSKLFSVQSTDSPANSTDDHETVWGVCGGVEQHVLDGFSLESLEECLATEIKSIECLKLKLLSSETDDYKDWLKDINAILFRKERKERSTLKVAFFGSTGSGKSSLINAMLKQELLPQSSFRACTPFAIEVGFNNDPEAASNIRLITHFVDKESWTQELNRFFSILRNVNGIDEVSLSQNDDDFKSMRDKLRVLCPDITSAQQLLQMCAEDIMEYGNIASCLGTEAVRTFSDAKDAYTAINDLIRPPKKVSSSAEPNTLRCLWPLVKSIRLETKNDTLRHGITIVDLPGTQDVNRARAMVAERHMKECSAVYIVAPSMRIADDTGADDLLLKAFHNQFHLDRMSLSVVATKCDELRGPDHEAGDLGVSDEIEELEQDLKNTEAQIAKCTEQKAILMVESQAAEDAMQGPKYLIQEYEKRKHNIEESILPNMLTFLSAGNKRKHDLLDGGEADVKSEIATNGVVASGDENSKYKTAKLDEILQIQRLRDDFEEKNAIAQEIAAKISAIDLELICLKDKEREIISKQWQLCIKARNDGNEDAVKTSFSNALRRFEDAGSGQQNKVPGSRGSTESMIEACVDDLRFFAVSAKAFENLCSRQRGERDKQDSMSLKSFRKFEDTGIPALVEHCINQAETKRRAHAEDLLKRIWQTRNGIYLSASGAEFGDHATEQDIKEAESELAEVLEEAGQSIQTSANNASKFIIDEIKRKVLRKINIGQEAAKAQADQITKRFGDSVTSHATYKAIMVREGAFTTSKDLHYDLNQDLLGPFMTAIRPPWRAFFAERLPEIITSQQTFCHAPISKLLSVVTQRAKDLGCPPKKIKLIWEQQGKYINALEDVSNAYQQDLQFGQREARDSCEHALSEALSEGYQTAGAVTGRHAMSRMKETMSLKVALSKATMFGKVGSKLRKEVDVFHRESTQRFLGGISDVLQSMHRDLASVFTIPETQPSKAELKFRREIIDMLEDTRPEKGKNESKAVMELLNEAMTS